MHLVRLTIITPIKRQGLIPPVVETLEDQIERSLEQLKSFDKPINKYIYLNGLQRTNQTLFYATLAAELEACLPIVYTPTGRVSLYPPCLSRSQTISWVDVRFAQWAKRARNLLTS